MRPVARRGPLQELPLEQFLLSETPSSNPLTQSRSHLGIKRPHSPSHYSPTKKRLLSEAGLFGHEMTRKSPACHFQDLLKGPNSPARRLDFGATKPQTSISAPLLALADVPMDISPVKKSGSAPAISVLAPSPELIEKKLRFDGNVMDSFSSVSPLASPTPARSIADDEMDLWFSPARPVRPAASPLQQPPLQPLPSLRVPRNVAPPDRQSTHYPGFDIHQDTHFELPTTYSRAAAATAAAASAQRDENTKEVDKENVAPRRKTRKVPDALGEAAWAKAGLLSPAVKAKAKVVPTSPAKKGIYDLPMLREGSVTPKKRASLAPMNTPGSAGSLMVISPAKTPLGKEERLARKRAMEEEVDFVTGSDDELDMDI